MIHLYSPNTLVGLLHAFDGPQYSCQFSTAGDTFVVGGQVDTVSVFDSQSRSLRKQIQRSSSTPVVDLDISPNGERCIFSGWEQQVSIGWLCGERTDSQVLEVQPQDQSKLCFFGTRFSPVNANTIIAAGNDCNLYCFDVESGISTSEAEGAHAADINAVGYLDAHTILTASDDHKIKMWDQRCLSSGECAVFQGHTEGLTSVEARELGGNLFVSNGKDQTIRIWDARNNQVPTTTTEPPPPATAPAPASSEEAAVSVQVLAGTTATEAGFWLPAGATTRVLVQAGSIAPTDGTFWPLMNNQRCLDVASESELSKPEWDYRSAGISRRRAARSHPDDASMRVLRGHTVLQTLIRAHWSPAGSSHQRCIYTGCSDGLVYMYDAASGKLVDSLRGHFGAVRDTAWHPQLPQLWSTSLDTTVAIWEYRHNSINEAATLEVQNWDEVMDFNPRDPGPCDDINAVSFLTETEFETPPTTPLNNMQGHSDEE